MSSKKTLNSLLEKTARRMTILQKGSMQETCPIGIIDFECWEWPQGVGLYGLFKYYEATGQKEYLDLIVGWFERRRKDGLPAKNVNTMAPLLTLAHLCELRPDPSSFALCLEWADWVMTEMPRTEEQGLQHVVSGALNEQQLWADTLFMTVLFLAKMGRLANRQDYIDESIRQFLLHIKLLTDRGTGLWFHGWTFVGRNHFGQALWARGNCWFTAGVVDFMEMLDLPGGVQRFLTETLDAQVSALASLQTEDGMWHTLLDDRQSYVETSATAGFGYGILKAVRKGYLDPKYASVGTKALNAVIRNIGSDGTVERVSYGTPMGLELDHYRTIPVCPMAYGQALALLVLGEGLKIAN
jgi:unsaturated rhamnogalacturonyl hydrolase